MARSTEELGAPGGPNTCFDRSANRAPPMTSQSSATTGQHRRFLYLDFDGVLHPADVWLIPGQGFRLGVSSEGHTLFEHANLLADMLRPYEDVRIVLSTSWVSGIGFQAALTRLPTELACLVVGATFEPSLHGRQFGTVARGYQILEHVKRNKVTDWAAIDDDSRDWPDEEREHLIPTDAVRGLDDSTSQARLTAWLRSGEW